MRERDINTGGFRDEERELRDTSGRPADQTPGAQADRDTANDVVGETAGGLAGAATGAALGSLAGPIGTIIGGIAGAVGGWWAGHAVVHAAAAYTEGDDAYYRSQFESRRAGGALHPDTTAGSAATATDYDSYRPAYQLGHLAAQNPAYGERTFDDIEAELRRGWNDEVSARHGQWHEVRDHARTGFERGREANVAGPGDVEVERRPTRGDSVERGTDRGTDEADVLDDRVDADRMSRPGRDATDRDTTDREAR